MNQNDMIKHYSLREKYHDWFISEHLASTDLRVCGWKLEDMRYLHEFHKDFNNCKLLCTNPNFYQDGEIIAKSRSHIIQASGITRFKYDDREWYAMNQIFRTFGSDVLKNLNNIEWNMTKEFIVVSKTNTRLLGIFDNWLELPTRKELGL